MEMKRLLIQIPGRKLLLGEEFGKRKEIVFITTKEKKRVEEFFLLKFQGENPKELKNKETITEIEYVPYESVSQVTVLVDNQKKYFVKIEDAGTRQAGYPGETVYISKVIITDLKGKTIISGNSESPGVSDTLVIDELVRKVEEGNKIKKGYKIYYLN